MRNGIHEKGPSRAERRAARGAVVAGIKTRRAHGFRFLAVAAMGCSLSLLAAVLPEDRFDARYHSYDGCGVKIKKGLVEESISSDYGVWQRSDTTLFNEPWVSEAAPVVASSAWTNEDTLTTVIRFYETPFIQNFVYRFAGDQMTIETRINVGFQPPDTVVMVGHFV